MQPNVEGGINSYTEALRSIDGHLQLKFVPGKGIARMKKEEYERVLRGLKSKDPETKVNKRFVPRSVSPEIKKSVASKYSLLNLRAESLFRLEKVNFSIKEKIEMLKRTLSDGLTREQAKRKAGEVYNNRSPWKTDLLVKKILEHLQQKAQTSHRQAFDALEKSFPKEERQKAATKVSDYKQKYFLARKQLLESLEINEKYTGDNNGLDHEKFIYFILACLRDPLYRQSNKHLPCKLSELESFPAYLDYIAVHKEQQRTFFTDEVSKSEQDLAFYENQKKLLYANLVGELDLYTLEEAVREIFADIKTKEEFKKVYKQYRRSDIETILRLHQERAQLLSQKELMKKMKDKPNETFPGKILHTDANGDTYHCFTLESPIHLEVEGSYINANGKIEERHCIGRDSQSYKHKVKKGEGVGFSIRKNGVDGEMLWTIWLNKKTGVVEQIKGMNNSVMKDLSDPGTAACLKALISLKESQLYGVKRIEDLQGLVGGGNGFLVYKGGKFVVTSLRELYNLEEGDKLLSGVVEIDIVSIDVDLLEKVLNAKAEISFETVFSERLFEIFGEREFRLMKLIVEKGRGDLANMFLKKCKYNVEIGSPIFLKLLTLSNGTWLGMFLGLLKFTSYLDIKVLEKLVDILFTVNQYSFFQTFESVVKRTPIEMHKVTSHHWQLIKLFMNKILDSRIDHMFDEVVYLHHHHNVFISYLSGRVKGSDMGTEKIQEDTKNFLNQIYSYYSPPKRVAIMVDKWLAKVFQNI
jgi:hypothetical protein